MSAGIAVRNPQLLAFARHYGVTVHTCEPADPANKGGSESTVKLAKADLVPTEANLLAEYASFAGLEAACLAFCEQVNARVHRVTRRAPVDMLAEEAARLHRLPEAPHTVAFGLTRTVASKTPMVAFEGGQYSVPSMLLKAQVWVRAHGVGAGTTRMRIKMAAAVTTGKLVGCADVDWALGHAAVNARFGEGDLASILDHHARTSNGPTHQAGEGRSLTQGTAGWAALGDHSITGDATTGDTDGVVA